MGGAFAAFRLVASPDPTRPYSVAAQHVTATGALAQGWDPAGVTLHVSAVGASLIETTSFGASDAVAMWFERWPAQYPDHLDKVFAQRVAITATVAVEPPAPAAPGLSLSFATRNPSADRLAFSVVVPRRDPATLELLDVRGRVLATQDVGALGSGPHLVTLTAPGRLPAGLYFACLRQGRERRTLKAAILR